MYNEKKYERKANRKYFNNNFNIELKRTKDKLNIHVLKLKLVSRNSPCWSQGIRLLYIPYHNYGFFWRVLNSVIPCSESNHKT